MNKFLKLFLFTALIFSSLLSAQTGRIIVDGYFTDWNDVSVLYEDPSGDNGSGNIDFGKLWVFNDKERLFISLETGDEINLQDDNEITVYIDGDNDISTGLQIGGIGAELRYTFGLRYGYVYDAGGNAQAVEHYQIGMVSAPTVSSERFEISFNRSAWINEPIFSAPEIKIYFQDYDGGDILPNDGILLYEFNNLDFEPLPLFSIEKENDGYLRLTAYNVLHDGIFDPNLYGHFQRILTAINPEIISFEEVSGHSAADMANLLNEMIPPENGTWRADKSDYDVIVASVFPITRMFDIATVDGSKRSAAFLLDLRPKFDTDFLIIGAHLKCCGGESNDAKRQREVDAIMKFIREAKEPGGDLTLTDKTPVAIMGDMNFVGSNLQPYTFLTGDIYDNDDYGEDFAPDWDETNFTDAFPVTTGSPFTFTWYDAESSFSPGKLDYLIYSDSVLKLKNSFSFFTPLLSEELLNEYNLDYFDATSASDHLPVVADFEFVNVTGIHDEYDSQIQSFKLYQNYPNPFSKNSGGNPITTIEYSVPFKSSLAPETLDKSGKVFAPQKVTLKIYDILGREVTELVNAEQLPGAYKVDFNAENLSSGVYFYKLTSGNFASSRKMIILK